jgi:hypothetical protein
VRTYVGIDQDTYGGMTPTGNIIRDAWVFGILPESETCAGWDGGRIQVVYDKVAATWDQYGHLVNQLPPEVRERHARIHGEAVKRARDLGWSPPMEED